VVANPHPPTQFMLAYLPTFMQQSSLSSDRPACWYWWPTPATNCHDPLTHSRGWTLNTRPSTHTLPDQRATGTQGAVLAATTVAQDKGCGLFG